MTAQWAGPAVVLLALAGCGDGAGRSSPPPKPSSPAAATASTPASSGPTAVDLRARREETAQHAVEQYYADLNEQHLHAAWARLAPGLQASMGGYEKWAAGFAHTVRTGASGLGANATDAHHASVTVTVRSVDRDVCGTRVAQRFVGTWDLTRRGGRWQATSIAMREAAGGTPISDRSKCPGSGTPPVASGPDGSSTSTTTSATGDSTRACYPGFTVPGFTVPAWTVPAWSSPAMTINGHYYPAHHYPAHRYPAHTYPAHTYAGHCYDVPKAFAVNNTTIRVSDYSSIDPSYSDGLTQRYWDSAGEDINVPDPTASGFGELNGAGFPRNQYVRSYVRRDGTFVHSYWRNSPSDGLPTCHVISC